VGARKKTLRRGRGDAAGQGSYSGRGHKGQKKRGSVRPQFEGGQLPIVKRLPYLRGFHNRFRIAYAAVNLDRLNGFDPGTEVTADTLRAAGIVRKWDERVKILAEGELTKPLKITVHAASKAARGKIEAAGGSVTVLDQPPAEETPAQPAPAKAAKPARAAKSAAKS
jgi:large subunit ribosomal protein L15